MNRQGSDEPGPATRSVHQTGSPTNVLMRFVLYNWDAYPINSGHIRGSTRLRMGEVRVRVRANLKLGVVKDIDDNWPRCHSECHRCVTASPNMVSEHVRESQMSR